MFLCEHPVPVSQLVTDSVRGTIATALLLLYHHTTTVQTVVVVVMLIRTPRLTQKGITFLGFGCRLWVL